MDAGIVDDTILNNTVRVNTTTGELKLEDNEATNIKNVTTLAELHVTKVNITEAIAGKIIKYEIVITNNGPSYARDIILKDIYNDSELTNMLYSLDGQSWTRYDASINIGTLANGQNKTILFEGFIKTTVRGNVINKAVIGSSTKLRENSTLEDDVAVNVKGDTTLDITKVANTTLVNPGDVIKYTVQITAGGLSDSLDVILTDNLSEMFFDVSKATYSVNGIDKGVWIGNANLGTISSGMTVNVVITVPVKAYVDVGKLNSITNFASVINSDKKAANDTNIVPINVIDLAVNKTANHQNKTYNYGDNVEYVIEIVNNGPGIATDIIATDNLPEGLKFINANVPGGWTLSISNNKITINGEKLANGEKVLITIIAKAAKSNTTLINNIKVNGTGFDSNISNNNDSETIKITPLVDLAITKVVDNANPLFDSIITYTITVVNNGPDKSFNVTVGDLLPDGVKFISSDGRYDPVTGVWFVGDLDANESVTLKIVVQVIKVGNITNNVNVTGTGHDTNLTNNNASVSVNVPESVLLNITKVANSTIIVAGENVGYTVVINNYGPSVASDVVLKDIFSSNELLNLQYSLNGVDWLDYDEAVSLGDINVGADVTVYFRAKVNGSVRGDVLNIVNITTGVDDARGNFTDNETVNVIANTTLVVIKDAEIKALNPGDTAHFVITVIAGGSSDSLNVKLEDILDAELLDIKSATYRINGGNLTDYTQIISLGNMHTGSKIIVDIYAAILGTTGQDIFNCVNVTSDEHPEGNTSNTTIHVNIADLEIIKIVNNATPNYGDEITYTITVRNNGPDNSTNIKVSEVLADNFKFISANASKGYYDLTNGVWAVGNLTNNETAKLVITVKIVKTGFIQNNVSVNGTGFDPNVTNNNATVNITVPQTADLSVVKIVNVDRVSVGNRITYTIVVKNNGPDTALDVYAVDKLSDALKFVSYKVSVGVYDPATGIWTIGNLTNKSNATLEITCIVLKTGVISNEVFVNGSTVDLNMTNNYGNVSVTVIPAPAPVHPADKDIMDSDEVAMGVDAMAKTGNPILALLVVLIFGIFGFGVSRRKK